MAEAVIAWTELYAMLSRRALFPTHNAVQHCNLCAVQHTQYLQVLCAPTGPTCHTGADEATLCGSALPERRARGERSWERAER